jgi:hypothetical protein
MSETGLERAYRRWLRWYPRTFRREHEAEILGVLMAGARRGQRRPELMECLDLAANALRMHLRPRVPRADRAVFRAIRLMYVGAMVELAAAITIVATMGEVKANVVSRSPGLTDAEWRSVAADHLWPKAIAAAVAVGFWLWMAWALGRRSRWAPIAFVVFFGLNTFSLLEGMVHGSAVYAGADLAVGMALWLVELVAVVLIVGVSVAARRSGGRGAGDDGRAPRSRRGLVRAADWIGRQMQVEKAP